MLPDDCFLPNGVVTKLQMRKGLLDIGINLTDMEYKRFWDRSGRDFVCGGHWTGRVEISPVGSLDRSSRDCGS